MPNLYLIRHAKAKKRGANYPDDSLRPLTLKGLEQAKNLSKALTTLGINFDKLFSSPYVRAIETAKPLNNCLREGEQQILLENLASARYDDLLIDLQHYSQESNNHLALVGHEPYLSEFANYMLKSPQEIIFKKGDLLQIYGELKAESMETKMLLTSSMVENIL